ncbi:hypothetical protein [Iodidimonas sp. SYSU 1G8]|uniref:hypothetical protein n=1 Tax=Iodidimonas sp. SYSU 1G8 TaxID=3133967 RepID=UPI0031FF38FA
MSLKGSPDWSQPVKAGGGEMYFAHEEPRRIYAPPLDLRVAVEPGGAPALALELIRLTGGADGPHVFGLLTIRFASHFAIAERQESVFLEHPDARVEPLIPRGGFLRFQAAAALDVPEELLTPKPLVWAGAGALTFAAQLGEAATALLNDALTNGMVTVTALAEVDALGLSSRANARVRFNPAALAPMISAAAVNGGSTVEAITAVLMGLGDTPAFGFIGLASNADKLAAAQACAERVIAHYGCLAPAADPASGPVFVIDTAAMLDGDVTWDLSDETLTPRGFVLASNPLETARQAAANDFRLTRDAPVVPFATGLHVLSIYPNLPARRVGVLMLSTEVRVRPFLPDRPQTVSASALFRDGDTTRTLPLRLSPAEPVAFDYQTVAFVTGAGGAQRLTGPVLRHEGLHLTIAPASFPVRFLRIESTPALLALATLHISCKGKRGDAAWSAEAGLDAATPSLAIAVPLDVAEGTLSVMATSHDHGRTLRLDTRPLDDCWLDLSSFPTAGPAMAEITCAFDDSAGLAAIECAPEDRLDETAAIGLVRLTPAMPKREWRWLVTNPLRDGFCWRWFRNPGEPPAPWSGRVDPAIGPLTLTSSARTSVSGEVEGVR